jgi:hypothetical protein
MSATNPWLCFQQNYKCSINQVDSGKLNNFKVFEDQKQMLTLDEWVLHIATCVI